MTQERMVKSITYCFESVSWFLELEKLRAFIQKLKSSMQRKDYYQINQCKKAPMNNRCIRPRLHYTGLHRSVGIYCLNYIYYSETTSRSKGFETFLQVSVIFVPAIVILIMYALIFVVAHKRQKMLRNGELGQTCTVENQRSALRQDLKIVRMLLVVVGVFSFVGFLKVLPFS